MASEKGSARTKMAAIVLAVILVALVVVGARAGYFDPLPMPSEYRPGAGRSFCLHLAVVAQHRSSQWMSAGVLAIGTAALCVGTGAMIANPHEPTPPRSAK